MLAWSRQEGESARAFEAFALYRDMGPERSLAKVGRGLGKSRGLMERWSSAHDWVDRVEALEARDSMIKLEAVETHLEAVADDHGKREVALQGRALALREMAAEQAEKMLEWPLTQQRVIREDDEDGVHVTYVFTPAGWNKGTAISLYGMMIGSGQEPAEPEPDLDWSDFTDEELQEYARLTDKAWGQGRSHGNGG